MKKWRPTYAHNPTGMDKIARSLMVALTVGVVALALFGCRRNGTTRYSIVNLPVAYKIK